MSGEDVKEKFQCPECGKAFDSQQSLAAHMKSHRSKEEQDSQARIEEAFKRIEAIERRLDELPKRAAEEFTKRFLADWDKIKKSLVDELADDVIPRVVERIRNGERIGQSIQANPVVAQPVAVPFVPVGEEVEVVGDKINYKVALNPEVFHLYNIFKAEVRRRGREWKGTFGDFVYMAIRDVLKMHGIIPTVLVLRKGQLFARIKVESEDGRESAPIEAPVQLPLEKLEGAGEAE
jgi:uncharacterized C2H2 Zn-finger protein